MRQMHETKYKQLHKFQNNKILQQQQQIYKTNNIFKFKN